MKWIIVVTALLLSGCLHPNTNVCGGGVECPVGTVCTTGGGCATPGDVAACNGLVDGDPCNTTTGGAGVCEGGACRTGLCGNGAIDVGERCDGDAGVDTAASETCSVDCQRIQVCGNTVEDPGEGCDDGNTNPADGCDACVPTTWRATALIGGSSLSVGLAFPSGVAVDRLGNLYLADTESTTTVRLVPADATGVVDGKGAVQTIYGRLADIVHLPASTLTFPASVTTCLTGLAVTGPTTVQFTDACTGLLIDLAREPAP